MSTSTLDTSPVTWRTDVPQNVPWDYFRLIVVGGITSVGFWNVATKQWWDQVAGEWLPASSVEAWAELPEPPKK